MKKVLVISYYFPPAGGPGVQRWLKFVKYLNHYGVEPVMYVPENADYPITDPTLAAEIPEGLKIYRGKIIEPNRILSRLGAKKAKDTSAGFIDSSSGKKGLLGKTLAWIRANIFIPDARMLWIRPSVRRCARILREEGIDTVISTGPPHSTHMIALALKKKRLCRRWIADFRDPWTKIDYFHHLPLTGPALKLHRKMESRVLSEADDVITVSRSMARDYQDRVKGFLHVITNGFDISDAPCGKTLPDEKFTISHIGSMNADRNPEELWETLGEICREKPSFASDLRIRLTGNVSPEVFQSLELSGLSGHTVHIPYAAHTEVVRMQYSSRVLLMMMNRTPDGAMYIAGKLFEYLAARRPVLLVGFSDSDAADILRDAGAGYAVDFEDKKSLKTAVETLYKSYKDGTDCTLSNKGSLDKYSREALTARLAREVILKP